MTPPADARPAAVAFLLPFVVAIAVGIPSVRGTFIRDDWDYVSGNPHVACAAGLREVFTSSFQPLKPLGLFRPVTTLSLRLDAALGGEERPWIFHATNLLLAGMGAALLAMLAGTLAGRRLGREAATRAALAAGLVFATHPARTEAVCWISGRAENLMVVFSLAALVLASGRESLPRTVLAAVCAALAAFSKEQGFALLLMIPLVARPVTGKRVVQAVVVFGALGLAFVLRWKALGGVLLRPGLPVFEGLGVTDRLAQGLRLLAEYARVTVRPTPLLFEYDASSLRASNGFADPLVLLGGALALALVAAMLFAGRWPLLGAAAALFLLPLVPVLHVIVPIGEDFAERFLALPVAAFALGFGAVAARFKAVGFGAAMVAAAAGGALFTLRAADYQSERILYEDLLTQAPKSPAAKSLLASTLLLPDGGARRPTQAEVGRAESLLREAVAADPGHAPARVTLAALRAQQRAPVNQPALPEDIELMQETMRRFPSLPSVHGILGLALFQRGVHQLAEPLLVKELEIMPLDLTAASALARLYEQQKQPWKAEPVVAAIRSRWEPLWRRFPGFGPVAIAYARTLSDGARDLDGARDVLRKASALACRAADRRAIEAALAELR